MNQDNKEHNERDIPNVTYIRRSAIYTEEITPKTKQNKTKQKNKDQLGRGQIFSRDLII